MIASLPMYWRSENAHIWQQFWHSIQRNLGGKDQSSLIAPNDIPDLFDHWTDPNLVLSMTCGLPFRTRLKGKVAYVGTLDFGTTKRAGNYCSVAIAKSDVRKDTTSLRMAYNMGDNQSGWAASFDPAFSDLKSRVVEHVQSGAHTASFNAVMQGSADFAFIDSVTWNLIKRFDTRAKNTVILGMTTPTPALPLITAHGNDVDSLRAAIRIAIGEIEIQSAKLIGGLPVFEVLPPQEYYAVPVPPAV